MSNPTDKALLADLKQDEINAKAANESKATQEHIAGAQGKLASAISQHSGATDLNAGQRDVSREVDASGGEVDREQLQEALEKRAKEEISGNEMHLEKGSEAARLQSAAEQYSLAKEGRQGQAESYLDKK